MQESCRLLQERRPRIRHPGVRTVTDASLSVHKDRCAERRPTPEERAIGVRQAEAAVRGAVAPVAAPVVVVNAGAVAGEVLRKQDVGEVVAARREARRASAGESPWWGTGHAHGAGG